MTAPVTTPVMATITASAPPSSASDTDINANDFSRFLADQRPMTDAETPSASPTCAANPAHASVRDADDTRPTGHDDNDDHDATDTQLAELALQIATQVAEFHATLGTSHSAALPDTTLGTINPGLRSLHNARTSPKLADLPHATAATAARDHDEKTVPRLSAALPSIAPLAVPASPNPNGLRPVGPHLAPRSGRTPALPSEPATTVPTWLVTAAVQPTPSHSQVPE